MEVERYVKSLDRASNVFKVLTVFAFFIGLARLAFILLPSLAAANLYGGVPGMGGTAGTLVIAALITGAAELLATAAAVFLLYTISLVLEFFAQLGEDVHLLRVSDWERRQVAGGKTQRMD